MRMVAVLVLVACGGAKPSPLRVHQEQPRCLTRCRDAEPEKHSRAERPTIDLTRLVPDLHDDLRWPLSDSAADKRDRRQLTATNGDAAQHRLSTHDAPDPEELDVLAARAYDAGAVADAVVLNARAMDLDARANDATQCRRLVKHVALSNGPASTLALESLRKRASRDRLCEQRLHAVTCWLAPASDCLRYLDDMQITGLALDALEVYYKWPTTATQAQWLKLAETARVAIAVDGAAELMVTAYEAAVETGCGQPLADSLQQASSKLQNTPHAPVYARRLASLTTRCPPTTAAMP